MGRGRTRIIAIFSARIFTGNAKKPWAEALGIKDHKMAIARFLRAIFFKRKEGIK